MEIISIGQAFCTMDPSGEGGCESCSTIEKNGIVGSGETDREIPPAKIFVGKFVGKFAIGESSN